MHGSYEWAHLSPRSPAMLRTLGIFSKVPGSLGGSDSSLLSACCLTLGSAGMMVFEPCEVG